VRDMRLEFVQGSGHWESVRQEMNELKRENQRLANLFQTKFGSMEDSLFRLCKDIRLDLSSQHATLNRVHLNQMLSLPFWSSLPSSGESLQFCRSVRTRIQRFERHHYPRLSLPNIKRLGTWSSQEINSVLLIDTNTPLVAKAFMIDLVDLILDNGQLPIIWALRYADYWDQRTTATDVIRMLVLQTMQVAAENLLRSPFPVTVEHLREAASLKDWVNILGRLLSSLPRVFIVLDADLLAYATGHERSEAAEMLDILRLGLSGRDNDIGAGSNSVKIVTATSSVSRAYTEKLERENACVKIHTGDSSDWRKSCRRRRPMARVRKAA